MPHPDETPERIDHSRHLKWALQALAATASDQLTLFPDAVATADELVADFDRSLSALREHGEDTLSAGQMQTLIALEERLALMSRDGVEFDADLWTDAALHSSPQWEEVRALAASALASFGWSLQAEDLPASR